MPESPQTLLLTIPQVARLLQVSEEFVRREAANGRIAHIKLSRQYRFKLEDVKLFIEGVRQPVRSGP